MAKGDTKKGGNKPKQPRNLNEYIWVNVDEPWIKTKDNISNDKLLKILTFYVTYSPCRKSSYSSFDLLTKWKKNPWIYPSFKSLLIESSTLVEGDSYIYVSAQKEFKKEWEKTIFENMFTGYIGREFVVFTNAGENNEFLELLHRIRNSLAHGRYAIKQQEKDLFFVFEDVSETDRKLFPVMRGALKVNTLLEWKKIFECTTKKAIELNDSIK